MKLFASVLLLVFTINDGVLMKAQLTTTGDTEWWKHATFYQIYPRSFKDDNNDGIGDLAGILSKIKHFPDTGVQAIWLSPIFDSPQEDLGYDISDYRKVDSDYGTNEDLAKLITKAHELGIKVILDYVPNHTSNKHEWFTKSEAKDEEYIDYYVWKDAKTDAKGNRQPPNNWISNFKKSAWEWSEKRQQYYLHQFEAAQPDLNYRNEKVVTAMKDVIKFWLDQGVDGFRVDAVPYLVEDENFPDEPKSDIDGYSPTDYEYLDHIYTKDQNKTFDIIYDWRKFVDNYTEACGGDQRVLMTEAYTTPENTVRYYGTLDGSTKGAHFSFNFLLITDITKDSTAHNISNTLNGWLDLLPDIYTPNWVIGNHDNHRVATRFGVERVDGLNMMTAVLPGISVTYYGEEIGQEDGEVTYDQGVDPTACSDKKTFDQVSRDFERTPFQWDNTTNAGFNTDHEPWLPVSDKYKETNLESQKSANKSHYKIYQSLMKLRQEDILRSGSCKIEALNDNVLMIQRTLDESSLVLVFNWGNKEDTVDLQDYVSGELTVVLSSIESTRNEGDEEDDSSSVKLAGYESVIFSSNTASSITGYLGYIIGIYLVKFFALS